MGNIEQFIQQKFNRNIESIEPFHNAFLVKFEYNEPHEFKGFCYICGRRTNVKSKAGYICSENRHSCCTIVYKCQVCGKVFQPQKPYLMLDKNNLTCSHKCSAKITMLKWHKDNPELSHELAIKQGKMNGGIAFQKEWDNNPKKMKQICSNGGLVGGKITADKGYWKHNGNLDIIQRCFDKNDELYNTEKGKLVREKQLESAYKGSYELWNNSKYEESRKKCLGNLLNNKYTRDSNGYITHINNIPIQQWYDHIQHKDIEFNELDFFIVPTGRAQDSTQRNSLLDDYLVKGNITWFIYIKFDELGNPLVVGKSGSKLVNVSGCDVVFDKNSDGGPARQYLIDNDLDWDKTQIAVYRCNTEQEALSKEIEIGVKYNLFFS